METIAEDNSGKIKFTFEMDINPPVMKLIRDDIDMMTDIMAQGMDTMRKQMQSRGKQGQGQQGYGHGYGMKMMHHGTETEENK